MATQDYTADGDEITPAPRTLTTALLKMEPAVSDAFVGRVAKRLIITIATPLERAAYPDHFLYMSFDGAHLSRLLSSTKLPDGYFSALADGSRRVIARSAQFGDFRLSPLPEWFVQETTGLSEGTLIGPPIGGNTDRIFAVQRLSAAPNWTLVVSAPIPTILLTWSGVMRPALWSMAAFVACAFGLLTLLRYNWVQAAKLRAEKEAAEKSALIEQLRGEDFRKSQLIGVVGHELRAPLIAQLGALDLIMAKRTDTIDGDLLERVRLDGHDMLTLLDDLLEVARLGTGEVKLRSIAFDPSKVAQEALSMLEPIARRNRNKIDIKIEATDYMLEGDPGALRRILINYGTNAAKFSKDSTITLSVDVTETSERLVTAEFAVTDNGIGIQGGDLPKLFKEFGITEMGRDYGASGTGLGLAICKKLADAMGGTVGVTSTPGQGSRFWLKVELRKIKAQPPTAFSESSRLDGMAILLAEDQEIIRMLTARQLEALGAKVTAAKDGLEAVDHAKAQRFDIILMDLRMPRMDGAEAARTIRQRQGPNRSTPIIGLTAHQTEGGAMQLSAGAITMCLRKPLDIDALLNAAAPEPAGTKNLANDT